MALTQNTLKKISDLRSRYYLACQNKEELAKLLHQSEVSEQVYNSNAIENSTLTLEDTEKILREIDLDRYISQRELFEAKNLARVITYIEKQSTQEALNTKTLLFLHKILLSNIRDPIAGRFRIAGEWVRVGDYIALDPEKIHDAMEKMMVDYYASAADHIVKRIAQLHLTFENIHPFVDGNGRIGRVMNNYILLREGYVPINIKFIEKKEYYAAFREYDNWKKTTLMEDIIAKALMNSYHKRLAYLEGKEIISLSEYAKKTKSSHSNCINKAKRQTIEAFLEKGKWKIGV